MGGFGLDYLNRFLIYVIIGGVTAPVLAWLGGRAYAYARHRLVPVKTVNARVVTKRLEVKTKDSNKKCITLYFVTFAHENSRREYELAPEKYALYAEGDAGTLKYHGSKFMDFEYAAASQAASPSVSS